MWVVIKATLWTLNLTWHKFFNKEKVIMGFGNLKLIEYSGIFFYLVLKGFPAQKKDLPLEKSCCFILNQTIERKKRKMFLGNVE